MPRIKKARVYGQHKVSKTNIGKEVVEIVSADSMFQVRGDIILKSKIKI